jgi:hypothetical protein
MTRQHFKALAEGMKDTRPTPDADDRILEQWDADVMAVALACRRFNSNFDRSKFYTACGGLFEVDEG